MKVGLDLRQIRPRSGGVRVLLREVLNVLVGSAPCDDAFYVFQSEGDPPLAGAGSDALTMETIAADQPRSAVDERATALRLDALFRGFPAGFHGFPPERQVVFVPDLIHDLLPGLFDDEVFRDRRRRFDVALRHAGAIATPSEFSRGTILEHPETRSADVFLMPGGPPRNGRFDDNGRVLGMERRPYFLFPANLWPHKNHGRLFQAFRQFLLTSGSDMELVLVGDPEGSSELWAEAADLPVRHLGFVPDEEIPALYAGASALVFFSLFEGFGLPVLEAFHFGVPVLGSNRGSLPEVAGGAMLACDPTDVGAMAEAMLTVMEDAALRERLVRLGSRRLAAYSWERSAVALHAALARVASRGRSSRCTPGAEVAAVERVDRARSPGLSIVISLTDVRGTGLSAVESAVRGQDCARDEFEVIVVTDGEDPSLERRVEALLGPGDRLVCGRTRNGAALADQGARVASGRILLFMEGHCELGPTCARELIAFFATGEYDAACVTSTGESANTFARMEQQLFEQHFQAWSQPGDWRKVLFRGFAILRQVYLDIGGFEWRYGGFADRALAAALHAGGHRVGWAERARIAHRNVTCYAELRGAIDEYVAGELRYLATRDPDYCARYFGEPDEWVDRRDWGREEARAALRALASFCGAGSRLLTMARGGETAHDGAAGPAMAGPPCEIRAGPSSASLRGASLRP